MNFSLEFRSRFGETMKLIVLTFLLLELTLIQSSPVTKKVEKRTAIESIKADSLSKAVNLKESSLKFENIKPLIPKVLTNIEAKNKSKIVKRNDLNPVENNSENDNLNREKKSCSLSGSNPSKICLEVNCGTPEMVVCQEDRPQLIQVSQPVIPPPPPPQQLIQVSQPPPQPLPTQIIQVPQQRVPPPTQIIQVPQPPPQPLPTQIIQVPQQRVPPPPQIIQVPQQPPQPPPQIQVQVPPQLPPPPPQIIQVPQQPPQPPPQIQVQVPQQPPPPPQVIQVPQQPPQPSYAQCVSLPSLPPPQQQVVYLPPPPPQPPPQQFVEISQPQIPPNPSPIVYQLSQPPPPPSSFCIETSSTANNPQSYQIRPYTPQTQSLSFASPQITSQPSAIQILPLQTQNSYVPAKSLNLFSSPKLQPLNLQATPGIQWQNKLAGLTGKCACAASPSPVHQLLASSWGSSLLPQGLRLARGPERSADAVETTGQVDNNNFQSKTASTNQPNFTSPTSTSA
ncbi:uncharacterized protein LOC127283409 [Leptopilina boulardi]|uniref:uncharacterized protein LOC127283409 n=1 Tax=Leptopilina boulardi TaxID=63433 RepID=UPI0021F5EEC9|nr:uncharacterized protein LOC127283409 [Leptopilina boulardi]